MSPAIPLSAKDPSLIRSAALLDDLFPAPRAFGVRLWDGSTLPGPDRPAFHLVLNHPGALRRMFSPPLERSLGEAFIYGDFDIEGDIFSAFSLIDDLATRSLSLSELARLIPIILSLPKASPNRPQGRGPARLRGARHSLARDRAAVQYHYDVGDDFYALWLDRHMQYSCGYFPTGTEDLDTAQERKLDHICRKLRLKPGERLLDIGCGWGGLALYAAQNYGVRVLGITVSQNQMLYANAAIARAHQRVGDRVIVKLQDYRDLRADSFDKIVSVGMFEHVGRSHLPEYFAHACRLVKPGGLFLNHGIARRPPVQYAIVASQKPCCPPAQRAPQARGRQRFIERYFLGPGSFVQGYVFPDGELVPVSEVNAVAEAAGFEVRDVENLREHYTLTLRQWVKRLETRRRQAIAATSEVVYRTWRLYMSASARSFETGNISVNQTLLAKLAHGGKVGLPLTRADLYAVDYAAPHRPAVA